MNIEFDKHSLIIDGERQLIKSAALHYFRTPGELLWKDRLTKLKAGGYNTVDLYLCWSFHSVKKGEYDFSGLRNIEKLLEITKEIGLFVIIRPGPYINAEISAGGFPPWTFSEKDFIPRNRINGDYTYSKNYMTLLKDWYNKVIPIINKFDNIIAFQIENEYSTNMAEPEYMQELYDLAKNNGIKVPIFHNDAYSAGLYADIVDIYACDIYPYISPDQKWKNESYIFDTLDHLEENVRSFKDDAPIYIAELQGGWFDKYFGPGYEDIRAALGDENINIVTKTALSQGVSMFNHYMGCGGTSWGNLGCDEVYTSYDFSAGIDESGIPQKNFYKAKEINYFLDSFNLSSTESIATTADIIENTVENLFAIIRKDNLNNCKWLFIRNLNHEKINISLKTAQNVNLEPFDMKILPIELSLNACQIDFSSVELFKKLVEENIETLYMIAEKDSYIEFSNFESVDYTDNLKTTKKKGVYKIEFEEEISENLTINFKNADKTTKIIFINKKTANKLWFIDNKAISGADFILGSPTKAAFAEPEKTTSLILKDWEKKACSHELDSGFQSSNWKSINKKFDCITNEIYDEFIWYKGEFKGKINEITLKAKHCWAIYLNGKFIKAHDSYCYDNLTEADEEIKISLKNTPQKDINELAVLCQNLGFDKGFSNDTNLPRGILEIALSPEKEISWKIKEGLTSEQNNWESMPYKEVEESNNKNLCWFSSEFGIDDDQLYSPRFISIENADFDKAIIYLNGIKIGRYWKSGCKQEKFYLPESFLSSKNRISLVIWFKNCENEALKDYHFDQKNVIIKIGSFGSYSLVETTQLP